MRAVGSVDVSFEAILSVRQGLPGRPNRPPNPAASGPVATTSTSCAARQPVLPSAIMVDGRRSIAPVPDAERIMSDQLLATRQPWIARVARPVTVGRAVGSGPDWTC